MIDFKNLLISEIIPDPNQPRKFYDEIAMDELIGSVREKGILQPILIRPGKQGKFMIVCGERRYRAALSVNAEFELRNTIPVVIRELSDDEALELQIIENLQRKDVHPMEEAVAFKSLMEGKHWTIEEISHRVSKNERYCRQRIRLNQLSSKWQSIFFKNGISITEAIRICALPEKQQNELYQECISAADEKDPHPEISIGAHKFAQFRGELHKAIFDLADPTLNKKMGPCTTCQYNSATALLFEDDKESPRCSNIPCFKLKTETYFNRELAKAKEDPAVLLINTGSGEPGLIQQLKKEGHAVLRQYQDFTEISFPEKPDWEEFREDNEDDDTTLVEMREAFDKEMAGYEKDLADYQKKIGTGKYKQAFVVEGYNDVGRHVYIELKKKAAQSEAKAKVEDGKADVTDIDEEVRRIRERDKASQQLDLRKIHATAVGLMLESAEFKKNASKLSKTELICAAAALLEAGSYEFKKWAKKELSLTGEYHSFPSIKNLEELEAVNEAILFKMLRNFMLEKLQSNLQYGINGKSSAILMLSRTYSADKIKRFQLDQADIAKARSARVADRISKLQAQKRQLEPEKPPAKKSTAKKSPAKKGAVKKSVKQLLKK